jgi:hypothetical protein
MINSDRIARSLEAGGKSCDIKPHEKYQNVHARQPKSQKKNICLNSSTANFEIGRGVKRTAHPANAAA